MFENLSEYVATQSRHVLLHNVRENLVTCTNTILYDYHGAIKQWEKEL